MTTQDRGSIFLGITPGPAREYLLRLFERARDRYTRVIVPCVGRFAGPLMAIRAGYRPDQVEASDISLFSSLIGYLASDQDVRQLYVRSTVPVPGLTAILETSDGLDYAAAAMVCLKIATFKSNNAYQAMVHDDLRRDWERHYAKARKNLQTLVAELKGITYRMADLFDEIDQAREDASTIVFCNPPAYKCLAPSHRILTADLRWVPAGDLRVGDQLLACDERRSSGHRARHFQWSVVTRSEPGRAQCVRVHLANGDTITCTADHPWLGSWLVPGHPFTSPRWIEAQVLASDQLFAGTSKYGTYVVKPLDVWGELHGYDDGWLAGMYDGEGHVSLGTDHAQVMLSQKPGQLLDRALELLRARGFSPGVQLAEKAHVAGIHSLNETLRLLGTLRPGRLLANLRAKDIGRQTLRIRRSHPLVQVVQVEHIGEQDIQSITTSSGTYFGEGYAHHNSGYSKQFDTHGLLEWAEPAVEQFDSSGVAHERIQYMAERSKGLVLYWRISQMIANDVSRAVWALTKPNFTEYLLCNRPEEARALSGGTVVSMPKLALSSPNHPVWGTADDRITAATSVAIVQTDRETALYYRDLFAHGLGATDARQFYLVLLDNKVFGAFALHPESFFRGEPYKWQAEGDPDLYLFENFGFNASSPHYSRLNRLLMMFITSEGFRDFWLARRQTWSLWDPAGITTVCLAKYPEVKVNRGILQLKTREQMEDGRYHLHYATKWHPGSLHDQLVRWVAKHGAMSLEPQET